ncbi:hypothetical protein PMZ80_000121 [Knufia obscura]|uniref:Uncharacterized protein n=1 Tax=Knufia obscura TaxID=1635080 RepID=A0ABR0RZZ3_9EURO|nr:hypothetical protein PMZ80_000121 [Knufia obscura]
MGCGSSSLKGEKQSAGTDDAPQPIKKVQTSFSTVDYDAAGQGRRDTTVGPLDPVRQKSDAPPPLPLPEKQDDSLNTSAAPDQSQPETKTTQADQIEFASKIPDQQPLVQDPVTRNAEDIENKEPYRDVTETPVTPFNTATFTTNDKLSQPQITSATIDRLGEKPSY